MKQSNMLLYILYQELASLRPGTVTCLTSLGVYMESLSQITNEHS